jgi:hypothetical protein
MAPDSTVATAAGSAVAMAASSKALTSGELMSIGFNLLDLRGGMILV